MVCSMLRIDSFDMGQQLQIFLKLKDGGLGMGSAWLRREAAWVGAWESGCHELCRTMGIATLQEFTAAGPQWDQRVKGMMASLRDEQGRNYKPSK